MGVGRDMAKILLDAVAAGARSALRTSSRRAPQQGPRPGGRQEPSPQTPREAPRQTRQETSHRDAPRRDTPRRDAPRRDDRRRDDPRDAPTGAYAGDFTGRARIEYRPVADGDADPGEVVWGWVPFEEDHSQGKDRPVLVVGRDGDHLLGLMLTSKDHDRDAAQESRYGRIWMDVGTGAWDAKRRPSEVRLDRVLRLTPSAVRREGAALGRDRFEDVAAALTELHGW